MKAMDPSIIGEPVDAGIQGTSANLSSALLAITPQTSIWSCPITLTQKEPDSRISFQEPESLPGRKATNGGSSDTEVNDPIAIPIGFPLLTAVTAVTPVGKCPRTLRNTSDSMPVIATP